MNRKQRRAAHVRRPKRLTLVEMAALLKAARPTMVYNFVLNRNAAGEVEGDLEPTTADWAWLADVQREGFDPRGINGPTYWRVTPTLYCSVFPHPSGQLELLMNDAQRIAGLQDEFMPEANEHAKATTDRRGHPWLSLAYQVSPAVAADIKSKGG